MKRNHGPFAYMPEPRRRISERAQAGFLLVIGLPVALMFAFGASMMVQDAWLNLNHVTFDGSAYCGKC